MGAILKNFGGIQGFWGDTDIWYIVNNANGVDFATFTF